MAAVDPDDDTIRRFVVQHHRFDPERRQHRRVAVAAFDNRNEFEAAIDQLAGDIERRRRSGEPVDSREFATGTEYSPGQRDEVAYGRFLQRAFAHGVDVRPLVRKRKPPRNMSFIFLEGDEATPRSPGPAPE